MKIGRFKTFQQGTFTQDNRNMTNSSETNQARFAQKTKQVSATEQDRNLRLNKALRENLLKRKKQNRLRQQQTTKKDSQSVEIIGMQD